MYIFSVQVRKILNRGGSMCTTKETQFVVDDEFHCVGQDIGEAEKEAKKAFPRGEIRSISVVSP